MENINEHDMTKRILDRIRSGNAQYNSLNENTQLNGNVTRQSKEVIDEHDMTKQMLGAMRENKIINEFRDSPELSTQNNTSTEEPTSDINDVVKIESGELGEESTKLNQMIGPVDLKLYEVYPKDNNVVMVGVLDSGIEFKFSKKEQAPYINMDNMRLDSDTVEIVKRIEAYYKIWLGDWAEKIREYTKSV